MKILLVGDVMLGRLVNNALEKLPPAWPWGDTLEVFKDADLRVCNLECAVTDRGEPWSETFKVFHFRTDAKNVASLARAGVDLVSLANNHVLDFGYEGLEETIRNLDRARILHAGAGVDLEAASSAAEFTAAGMSGAFLAFTDNEPGWAAAADKPGVCYLPADPEDPAAVEFLARVSDAKARTGFVIVSAHWGPNWGRRPVPSHPLLARALVEAGADVVFGHSCHVFQGVEFYRGRPIIYSAGDFVDDYAVDEVERNDESFMYTVVVEDGRVEALELRPTVIDDFQANLAPGARGERMAEKVSRLSGEFGTRSAWDPKKQLLRMTP